MKYDKKNPRTKIKKKIKVEILVTKTTTIKIWMTSANLNDERKYKIKKKRLLMTFHPLKNCTCRNIWKKTNDASKIVRKDSA